MSVSSLQLEPGDGRLIRRPRAAVLIEDPTRAASLVQAVSAPVAGSVLAAIQDQIVECDFDISPLVAIEWDDAEVVIMLFGDIAVRTSARTAPTLSAAAAGTWIEHRTAIVDGVSISSEGVEPLSDTQLEAGIVPARGFVLRLGPAKAALEVPESGESHRAGHNPSHVVVARSEIVADEPLAGRETAGERDANNPSEDDTEPHGGPTKFVATEPQDRISGLFGAPEPASPTSPFARPEEGQAPHSGDGLRPDSPLLGDTEPDVADRVVSSGSAPLVDSRECLSCGWVNQPARTECDRCGATELGPIAANPRPVVCRLRLPDGSIIPVNSRVVLGRSPDGDGDTTAIAIDDPEQLISGTHAAIDVDGWDVRVTDLGSSNGTQVRNAFGLVDVEPGVPSLLTVEDEILIGSLWITVLSALPEGEAG